MDHVRRLIVLLLLALSCLNAHATIPATSFTEYNCNYGGWFPSVSQALAGWAGYSNADFAGGPYQFSSGCQVWRKSTSSYINVNGGSARAAYSCPANSTLSGTGGASVCTCNTNYTQSGSVCLSDNEVLCNALSGTETYASTPGNVNPGASSCNPTGCSATFGGTVIRVKNPQGQYVTEGAVTFTGGTCTYSAETGVTQDTCPGGSQGEVNGISVCVPYDPKLNTIESVGASDETTVEGADTTVTGTSSSTTCANGTCTTTKETTTTVNGGSPTTKSTSTNEPQSDFCAKNPRAAQCGDGGQFTGSCQSSFTCTGDAVQCATARATNDHLCRFKDLMEMDSSTQSLVNSVIAGTWIENPKDNPTTKPLGTFDQTNPFGETCPGDVAMVTTIGTLNIPLSNFCAQLQMMGNLLVAFTLLASTVFVIKGST